MKQFFFFLLTIPFLAQSQSSPVIPERKWSIALECKRKQDKASMVNDNPEQGNHIETDERVLAGSLLLKYHWKPNWGLEAGYAFESYVYGFSVQLTEGFYWSSPTTYMLTHMIPIRVNYQGLHTQLFKRRLAVEPALGLITAIRHNDGDIGGDGQGTYTSPTLMLTDESRKGIEYDIRRVFPLLDFRGQVSYALNPYFSFFIGGGYTQGLMVIGRVNTTYFRPPSTTIKYIQKEYKGSNIYLNVGINASL